MINTSESWKNLYKDDELFPESNVQVVCSECLDTSNYTVEALNYDSNMCDLLSFKKKGDEIERQIPPQIATFEWNYWLLDGTFIIQDTGELMHGFVSDVLSDENGNFPENQIPLISFTPNINNVFETNFTIKYVTGFAKDIYLQYYFGNNLDDSEATIIGPYYVYKSRYSSSIHPGKLFVLKIYSWSMPFRRARISEFLIGLRMFFDKTNLSKFTHKRMMDMVNVELPQNDCNISILDPKSVYVDDGNPDNIFYGAFNDTAEFKVYYGFKIQNEWEYNLIDTMVLQKIFHPENGLETEIVLESTINKWNKKFDKAQNATDENPQWLSYNGFIEKISYLTDEKITNSSSNKFSTVIKNNLVNSAQRNSSYYDRTLKEHFQMLVSILTSCILRNNIGEYTVKGFVGTDGNFTSSYINTVKKTSNILTLDNCFEYPEIDKVLDIQKITLQAYNTQGSTSEKTKVSKKWDIIGIEQSAENPLMIFNETASDWGFKKSDGIQNIYMNWLHEFMSGAKKISVNCRINPAWETGDIIGIELKNGTISIGYITEINIEYSGYPKGTLSILAPKAFNN